MTGMKGIIIGCIWFLAGDGNGPINYMLMILEMNYVFVIIKKVVKCQNIIYNIKIHNKYFRMSIFANGDFKIENSWNKRPTSK